MSAVCECGTEFPADQATTDVFGLTLCPECALDPDSSVLCTVCGDNAPVRIYGEPTLLDTTYIAVCRICDGVASEEAA